MTRPMTSPCCSGFRSTAQRESACRRSRDRARAVTLRRIPHDHSHDAPRQNDLEVVAMLHVRHDECENESDRQTKHDSQEQGIYFAREEANRDTGDQTFDRRADNDAGELRPHRRREPRRSSIDCAKNRTQQKSEQNFVHGRPPFVAAILSLFTVLYNGGKISFRANDEKLEAGGRASLSRLLSIR